MCATTFRARALGDHTAPLSPPAPCMHTPQSSCPCMPCALHTPCGFLAGAPAPDGIRLVTSPLPPPFLQVEFADVILINKCDLVTAGERVRAETGLGVI